jgi:hypothetical protein
MRENLRPEAASYFRGAKLIQVRYRSPVEANFSFQLQQAADQGHGVMVRTRHGWKIQSW